MERTQNQAWTELREALETLIKLQGTTDEKAETNARHKVEILELELVAFMQKAA